MSTLMEILKISKLIKSLIIEENIEATQKALLEKNNLIKEYRQKDDVLEDFELMKKINQLDEENIQNLQVLMKTAKENIQKIKFEKGKVKNKNSRVKKYKTAQRSSGYRFDRKK